MCARDAFTYEFVHNQRQLLYNYFVFFVAMSHSKAKKMPPRSHRHRQTIRFAKYALERIEELGLPADPQSFELWFVYATGQNAELNKVIDTALAAPHGLSESEFDQLCNMHIVTKQFTTRLDSTAAGLSDEITQVMGMLGAAAASSKHYSVQLAEGAENIGRTDNISILKPVVEALLESTKEKELETRTLQVNLEESKAKTSTLQDEVIALRAEQLKDPLTRIGNRQYFDQSLIDLTFTAKTHDQPLSLLFCDIDNFKKFNDSFGHQIGDDVLRLAAVMIKDSLREGDIAGRYGGEEFGILLPNTTLQSATEIAECIRNAFSARDLKNRGTGETIGRITISIGIAELKKTETSVEFIERADKCLYAAKQTGRNRVISKHEANTD
jgi:diguanylate cyclase